MNKIFLEAIRIIFSIIVIILPIITIVMLIIKLLGHSPTETTILFSVVGILAALQVVIIGILLQIKGDGRNLKGNIGELKEFKRQTIEKIKEIERKI